MEEVIISVSRRSCWLRLGPEGGFSPSGKPRKAKLCGFQLVGLGRRILRTEKPPQLAGLACIMYEFYEIWGERTDADNGFSYVGLQGQFL